MDLSRLNTGNVDLSSYDAVGTRDSYLLCSSREPQIEQPCEHVTPLCMSRTR